MTRRDFVLIADVIKKEASLYDTVSGVDAIRTISFVAQAFANKLAQENPAFNSERFMKACKVD